MVPTNRDTSLLGENNGTIIWMIKILIPIYLPGWLNLGGVVYAKTKLFSGGIGLKSTVIL